MFSLFGSNKTKMVEEHQALPGSPNPTPGLPERHHVLDAPLQGPFPDGMQVAMFGLGCFWGAERVFWTLDGVYSTAVGYSAGFTPNPTYEEVCSGRTGHNEVVQVVFDPTKISFTDLLRAFWESHDPTQGMRQGHDVGTQYRSGIYVFGDEQRAQAEASARAFGDALAAAGHGPVTTEIIGAKPFYYAEGYHQQYLAKNPGGYCGLGGTGVSCPVGLDV
ncbi:MAG: peptide-methionine (S)-S-oxide reductase MsrA [Myxococcales bacterium]|nr:peptide-methionine (S)-S-oxide reductase MsrA [Myxococcales bacterium]